MDSRINLNTLSLLIPVLVVLLHPRPARAYIGGINPGQLLPASVKIAMSDSNCSGVKVSDRFVLTAAHCNLLSGLNPGNTVLLINSKGTAEPENSIERVVRQIYLHPTWNPDQYIEDQSVDLALVEFESLSLFQTAKISIVPIHESDRVVVGGFGCKGDGYPMFANLTVAPKRISRVAPLVFSVGLQDDTSDSSRSFGCEGDSGGAAYRENPITGEFEVVGINSNVTAGESSFEVDSTTGKILSSSARAPLFNVSRLGFEVGQDPQGIVAWLTGILPPESFSRAK